MIDMNRTTHLPEACSRALLDVSRALEFALGHPYTDDIVAQRARSKVIADVALLCRGIARTLCVDPEATLLSVVLPYMEATFDDN